MPKSTAFENGVEYAIQRAERLAWLNDHVEFVALLREDLGHGTVPRSPYPPACTTCGEEFTPTVTNPYRCQDCTRRAYK